MAWKNFLLNRFRKSFNTAAKNSKKTLLDIRKSRLFVELLEDRVVPANFTAGDLAILQAASASNTTASVLELSPTTPASNPIQTISIPSTGTNAIEISGSATSTGYVVDSNDGSFVEFNGVNSTATGNVNTLNPRAVVALNNSATVSLPTTYTGITTGGTQTRAATSLDDTNWFIADQTGLYTNGATAPSPAGNFRAVKSFGGNVYVGENSSTSGVAPIYTIATPSGGTLAALPGFTTNDSTLQDYYLVSSGTHGSTFDELYTLDDTTATAGTINKFSLVSGTWTSNGTYTTNFGGFGLAAARDSGSGAFLYVSTGTGATTANKVMKLDDTAGFNTPINITTANNVTLYTAPTGTIVKGVAFAPVVDTGTTTTVTSVTPLSALTTQQVTFTATVTANSGSTAPTAGIVQFRDSGASGPLLATATTPTTSSTTATFTASMTVPLGTYSDIQAFYISNVGSTFASSVSPVYGSTLSVTGPVAPTITSLNNTYFTAGQSNTFNVTATGTTPITFSETGTLPTGVTLSSAGVLSGTPAAVAQTTSYTFTITAQNGTAPNATQSFTLYIVPAATTPVAFTPGDILVYRVGDGGLTYGSQGSSGISSGGYSAAIFIDEYTPAGTFVQTITVPSVVNGSNLATVASLTASSEGMLSLSSDGHSVVFTGYNATVGTANIAGSSSNTVARVIGTITAGTTPAVTTSTTTADYNANNIRSAATVDGLEFWVSGNSPSSVAGVRYDNVPGASSTTVGVTNTTNTNAVAVIGGQLYFSTRTGPGSPTAFNQGPGVYASSTALPTSASSPPDTTLIGASPSADQFTIMDMDGSKTLTAGDRLYYVDDSGGTTGGLYRADYSGSAWGTPVLVSTDIISSLEGLTGKALSGTSAQLFATNQATSIGATTTYSTKLLSLTDANSTPTTGLTWTTLQSYSDTGSTASPVEQFRGVTIVPTPAGSTTDTVTLTPSAGPYTAGFPITFTAAVSPTAATGWISFVNNGVTLATVPVSSGQAMFTTSSLAGGMQTVTAYYDGDSTYQANNGSTTINISGGVAPTITSTNAASVVTGQSGHFQVTATGNPGTFSYSLTSAPSWVTINSSGVLSYTAPSGLTGLTPFAFTIMVSNGVNPAASQSFTLIVSDGSFLPGDLAIWQGNNGSSNNTTLSIVEVNPAIPNEGTATQSNPQTISINGTSGSTALRVSASAKTTGYLADTNDETQLAFTGAEVTSGSANANTITARGVGTLNSSGTFNLATSYTGVSGEQTRGATSIDDSTWYIADQSGLYSNNTTSPSPAANILTTKSFGGTVFVGSASLASMISTVAAPTGSSFVGLPGLPTDANFRDFYMIGTGQNLNTNGASASPTVFDVLYTVDWTSATAGIISKYSLVGTTWVSNGSYNTTFGGGGIAAAVNGSGAVLYVTTGDDRNTAASDNNSVIELFDTAGWNTAISINTANNVTLYSATGGAVMKGVAFAPLAATTLTETVSSHSVQPGTTITITANLSSPNAPGGINTGLVYFFDGTTVLNPSGTAVVNGVASLGPITLALGQHHIYEYYTGTTTIADATTPMQTVAVTGNTASSVSITATPNPSTVGATVTLTATVTTGATGTVEFFDNGTSLGTATISGSMASLPVSTLSLGTHSNITATYDGDNTYLGSNSAAISETINAGATVAVNDGTTNAYGTVTAGGSVTFTATVTGNGIPANGMPTGTVQFYENGVAVGAPVTLTGSGNVFTATTSITIGQSGVQTAGINGSQLITVTYLSGSGNSYANASSTIPWIETAMQTFAHGDLLVLDRPNNPSNASQLVALNEYTPGGTLVQTVYLPDQTGGTPGQTGVTTNTFGLSGHASTEGALALSGNESYLTAFGFDLPLGTPSATSTSSATSPRTVASITVAGVVNTSTTVEESDGVTMQNARGAVTNDGSTYYVVGTGNTSTTGIALATNGTLNNPPTAIGPNNTTGYGAEILGGQLYVSTQDSTSPIEQVGTGLPTGSTTFTALPGLETAYTTASLFTPPGGPGTITPNPYGFLLFNHLTGTSVNPDTLYVADQTYGLLKFALVSGQWTFESQKINNNNGIEGLAGYEVSPGASGYSFVLYATAAISTGNPGNQLITFTDSAAFNAPNTGGLFTVLASAANPTDTFSGLAFAPLNLTTTAVSVAPNPSVFGQSITLTATVVDTNNTDSPTGPVTFFIDGVQVGTGMLSTNSGTMETATFLYSGTPLTVGNHNITASYGGDTNDGTSTTTTPTTETVNSAGFMLGDLVVYQVGNGSGTPSASGAPVNLLDYSTGGTLNSTVSTGIFANGTSTTEGALNLETDGANLVVPGYATSVGTGNINVATTARVVALVNAAGSTDATSTIPGSAFGTGNIRSAASADGTSLYAASSANGIIYTSHGSTTDTQLTASDNERNLSIFNPGTGNQLYTDSSSSTGASGSGLFGPGTVGSGLPTSATQTITALPGFSTTGSNNQQFAFYSPTVVYIADANTSGTSGLAAGGIQKWTYNGTTWVEASYTELMDTSGNADAGLLGLIIGATNTITGAVTLYGTTTGNTSTFPNKLVSFVDNGTSFTAPTTLATAGSGFAFRGVAFTPSSLPVITSAPVATFYTGTSNTFNVVASNSPTSYAYAVIGGGSLPSGINFNTANGQFSGNPSTGGSFELAITATNSTGTSFQQIFQLTVRVVPSLTSATSTTFYTGGSNSFQVTATNSPTSYAYMLVSGTLPAGFSFSTSTGLITASPTATGSPVATLSITATNSAGTSQAQTFTLNVATGVAPTLTSTSGSLLAGIGAAASNSFQMTATPGTPSTVTYSATGMPSGVTLSSSGLLSGLVSGGTYTFPVTVSNGINSSTTSFTLTATGLAGSITKTQEVEDTGPFGNDTTYADIYGSTANTYPNFVTEDFSIPARPNATSLNSLTLSFPEHYYTAETGGTVDLYLATGSGATLTLTVGTTPPAHQTGQNGYAAIDPALMPVGQDGGTLPIGQASYTPSSTNPGALTYTLSSAFLTANPTLASYLLSDLSTGHFRFILAADTATVSDELTGYQGSPLSGINVNYTPGAAPYITSANSTTFSQGVAGQTFQVTADGSTSPTPITFSATYSGGSGTGVPGVTLNSAGLLSGTPTAAGSYMFTITASNGQTASYPSTQAFTLTVTAPVFTSALGVGEPYNTAFNFQFATSPALTSLNYTGTLPTGLSLSATGLLTGMTTQVGEFPITVTAVTPVGNASETFYITARPQTGTTHFFAGDVVVYRTGDGTATNFVTDTADAVFLDEYSPAGILFQSFALPTATSGSTNPLTQVPSYGADGLLSDSGDGHSLLITGYDSTPGTTSIAPETSASTLPAQTVGVVTYSGSIDTGTVDTNHGGVVRSATTDGSSGNIWLGTSTGGVRVTSLDTFGASTSVSSSPTGNTRSVVVVNGQLYVSSGSSTATGIDTVGTGLPTSSGATMSLLPGLTTAQFGGFGPYAYFFATLNGGASPDTLYVANSQIGIEKFSLVSGSWVASGTIAGNANTVNGNSGANEALGITGEVNGSTVTLFMTTSSFNTAGAGGTATTGGALYIIADSSGYNQNITGNGTSFTTLTPAATAATNTNFQGIALAPTDYADLAPIFIAPSPTTPVSVTFVTTVPNSYQVNTQTASTDTVAQFNSGAGGYSATGLPAGVTISPTTGLISGMPLATDPIQSYSVTIMAQNNQGTTTNTNLTINLVAAAAPTFTTPTSITGTVTSVNSATILAGINATIQLTATGEPTTITYSASTGGGQTGLPSTITVSSAGVLSGVPTVDGTYTFTVTASNGVSPMATETFTLTVTGIPGAPTTSATVRIPVPPATSGVVGLTGTAPNQTWNTTNIDPEGTSQTGFTGFALVDEQLPATPSAASINSVTFQVNETTQFAGTTGTIELWIATGSGLTPPIPPLVSNSNFLSGPTLFDSSLNYAGADGVGGMVPLATVTYTPNHGNAVLNFTITFNSNGTIGTNTDTTAYNTILSALQGGTKVRLLLETSNNTPSAGLSGAGETPPTGDVAPGISIIATLVTPPTISTQPASATIDNGQSDTLSVTAANGTTPYSYQWYIGASGTTTNPISGATSATYAAAPTSTTSYWVQVTDANSNQVNSNTATITVDAALTISTQPASATIDNGQSDTLSVTAANGTTPYSYQWYIGASGTTTNPISGATSATYAASPTSTTSYWVKITDSANGTAGSTFVNSSTATLTVNAALSISTQPAGATIDNGQSDTLSVTAANGTTPYSYQWYIGASGTTTNPISGATSATYAASPTSTTSYWVKITDSANGTAGATSVNSSTTTITVNAALSISTQPANGSINSGQTDTLSVTAANGTTPYSYQWYIGTSGTTTNPISGATSASYAASPTSTTSYWVKITDSANGTAGASTINSNTATVTVTAPSTFQITSTTLLDGGAGFLLTFDAPYDISALNLYTGDSGGTLDARDVQITGPGGATFGGTATDTMRFNAVPVDSTHLELILTGLNHVTAAPVLAAGTYSVTLDGGSGDGAFKQLSNGAFLDGNGDGTITATDNYTTNVTVTAIPATTAVVTIGDLVAGPGQTVTVPLVLSGGTGSVSDVTSVDLQFAQPYPSAYSVTGFTVNSSIPGISAAFNAATGILTMSSASTFASSDSPLLLGNFTFAVSGLGNSGTAPGIGTKTPIDITVTSVGDHAYNPKPYVGVDGFHISAYLGDLASATGTYNGTDVSQLQGLITQGVKALTLYQNADPKLIADVNKDGNVNGTDVSQLQARIIGGTSVIPTLPSGASGVGTGGFDPYTYLDTTGLTAAPGQTSILVPVYVNNTSSSQIVIASGDYALEFDPSKLSFAGVVAGTIANGSLFESNGTTHAGAFSIASNVVGGTTNPNYATVLMTGSTAAGTGAALAPGEVETIYYFKFNVLSNAPTGNTTLNMLDDSGYTNLSDGTNPLVLNPAPSDTFEAGTEGQLGEEDAYLSIQAASVREFFPTNFAVSAGQTVSIPLYLQTGSTPMTIASADIHILFDPSLITINSVTAGDVSDGTATGPTGGGAFSIAYNVPNPGELIATGSTAAGTGGTVPANTTTTLYYINLTVSASAAPGSTIPLNLADNGITNTSDGTNPITISPAPTDAANDANVDGSLVVTIQPNQPPHVTVPASTAQLLFNPATGNGYHTGTPNSVAVGGISVSDVNASGQAETGIEQVTVTVSGSGSNTNYGTVALTLSGAATVTAGASGTGTVTIQGTLTDLNATLATVVYTPGAGFYGTGTLTMTADDLGNSGYSGSFGHLTDTKATNVSVVGLFISEIMLNRSGNTTLSPNQYIEFFSTVPNYLIPANVYLVGIEGDNNNPVNSANNPGLVQDIFNLGLGFTTGPNGYLALLDKGGLTTYGGFLDINGIAFANNGSGNGFGNAGSTSTFGGHSGVHTGQATGTSARAGAGTNELVTDIELGSESFLLIEAPAAPTTSVDIDSSNAGTPGGTAYATWNVMDGVGILDNVNGTSPNVDRSYAPITFKDSRSNGTAVGNVVTTTNFTATYVARISQNTGATGADWLASIPTGTAGNLVLSVTQSTAYGGQAINNVGGPNYWAPEETVVVNDGSSSQHSQVSELTVTFSEPVDIASLQGDFVVKDSSGNAVATTVTVIAGTDNGDGTASGVTQVVITFNNDAGPDTYAFAGSDPFGNTRGLVDGNYFLNTLVAGITNNGISLDGAHTGVGGSTSPGSSTSEIDEFWRLYGDTDGRRVVDGTDTVAFRNANGSSMVAGAPVTITGASQASNGTVTITTQGPSGFLVGQQVDINNISNSGYNGTFIVTSVNGNSFTYVTTPGLGSATILGGETANSSAVNYQWYLDYDMDGTIDVGNTVDRTALINNLFTTLAP